MDAFYHVVWLRGVFAVPDGAAYGGFRAAVQAVLGDAAAHGASCNRAHESSFCDVCLAGAPVEVCGVAVCGGRCEKRARMLIECLFFDATWAGALAPCAVRCHRMVASSDRWDVMESTLLSETWSDEDGAEVGENEVDWLALTVEDEVLDATAAVLTRNATALTAALAVLCRVVTYDYVTARQLYIDVREALHSIEFRSDQARSVYNAVVAALFPQTSEHETAPELVPHMARFTDFIRRSAGMATTTVRLGCTAALARSRASPVECALTADHTLQVHRSQFGNHVEVQWPAGAISWLECRMTLHVWTNVLKLVDRMHTLIKPRPDGVGIVLRESDFVRLLRYAPAHLHCARAISLRMPVYKMLCQNYVQLNMDRDEAAAVLFAADYMSLVADGVPARILRTPHADLGLLHAVLSVFGDTLALHAMLPYMDMQGLRMSSRTKTAPTLAAPRCEIFLDTSHIASVVDGFAWSSTTIYGLLLGFFCINEPHVIASSAVRDLHQVMTANILEQRNHVAAMQVIAELCGRLSVPTEVIDGAEFVDVPLQMGGSFPADTAPVACLYGLLTSRLFDRKQAAKILLAIRLAPGKTVVFPKPAPLRPAAMRAEGIAGLRALHREYAARVPDAPYARLYDAPRVAELGCMQYFTFVLEMLTYTQSTTPDYDNLEQCQREFGRFGAHPHTPLIMESYRGTMTPQHVLRYTRRDAAHNPAQSTHAYELESGVFQHQVVPTVRHRAAQCGQDVTRTARFHGSDPFMRECLFTIPVSTVRAKMPRWQAKRKLDQLIDLRKSADPGIMKRMYNPNPSGPHARARSSGLWSSEK